MNSIHTKTKLTGIIVATALLFFFSCKKEAVKQNVSATSQTQNSITSGYKVQDYLDRMRKRLQQNAAVMNSQLKNNRVQMLRVLHNAALISSARNKMKNNITNGLVLDAVSNANNSHKNVLNVPGDYSNLQDAVDYFFVNAPSGGGKIIIHGTTIINADLAVDVPGLNIQGAGGGTITSSGSAAVQLLAKGIEVSHLNINVSLIINNTAGGAYLHENIISSTESTGSNMLIAIHGASGCKIDNNTIQEAVSGNNSTAVFSDGGSTGNEFANDKVLNFATGLEDFGPPFGPFYSSGTGLQLVNDISPVIQNCTFNNNFTAVNLIACTKATVDNALINITPASFGNGVFDQPITDDLGNVLAASSGTKVSNCKINPKVTTYTAYFSAISIALMNSVNAVVSDCSAIYAGNGVSLDQCTNAQVTNGVFNYNETGFVDLGSNGTRASNIISSNNQFFGLLISESATGIPPDYLTLYIVLETTGDFENFTCNANGLDGISLHGTTGCTLKNCVANNNGSIGLSVEQVMLFLPVPPYNQSVIIPSDNNKIIGNSARNNTLFDYDQVISTNLTFINNSFSKTSIN